MRRTSFTASLAFVAAIGIVACGSQPPSTTTFSTTCLHYASYLTSGKCGWPPIPATEAERVMPRWAQRCQDTLAMPGSSITSAALDQCLTLLESGECWSANSPDVCLSAGTLQGGAACNEYGAQCQSGECLQGASAPCGTCLPAVALGQTCDPNVLTNKCELGTECTGAAQSTCSSVTLGAAGANCAQSSDCAAGLVCGPSGTCAAPLPNGSPCLEPFSCAYPLVCNMNADTTTTCQPAGASGASCLTDEYCADGLGCSTAQTCGAITWQGPGQPCDGSLVRCLVGGCPSSDTQPVCPTVVKDGDPCSAVDPTQVCDVAAVCFQGKCVLASSVKCQ
jgi:hypothetical protein